MNQEIKIKNTELHTFEGVAVGRVFNFTDGASISVDIEVGEMYNSDGSIYDLDAYASGGTSLLVKEAYVKIIKSLGVEIQLGIKYKDRKGKIYALHESTFEEELKLITKGVDFDPDSKQYTDSSNLAWRNTISRIEKIITKEKQS